MYNIPSGIRLLSSVQSEQSDKESCISADSTKTEDTTNIKNIGKQPKVTQLEAATASGHWNYAIRAHTARVHEYFGTFGASPPEEGLRRTQVQVC